ncbi:hypothetical protein GF385_03915 [Candidatus Dependentiae bacterium]|nr:hypothetical protein [Candidatus Dependentiae bacterium]
MKSKKNFIALMLIFVYSNLFCDGYIQIHNKTKFPAIVSYNFGREKEIKVNKKQNSPILSTKRWFCVRNVKKLNIKLYYKDKIVESRLIDKLNIPVERNNVTHIYILYVKESHKNPKLRIACMKNGKMLENVYSENKKDSPSVKSFCKNELKREMKPSIGYLPKKEKNEKAMLLIKNKSDIPLKIKTPSISFYEDHARIKHVYLSPGDYYFQKIDEGFEAKNFSIKEVDGKLNKSLEKIKIPRGKLTTIDITRYGDSKLTTKIKREKRIS